MRTSGWVLPMLMVAACGGGASPTSPTGQLPLFHAGSYMLLLSGGSTECNDLSSPQAGTSVQVHVTLAFDSGAWVGRPTISDGGNFQLRLTGTSGTAGTQSPVSSPVAGTFSGAAVDSFSPSREVVPTGTRADFSPPGSVSGEVLPTGFLAQGVVTSPVVFSRNSRSVTCPAGEVLWSLFLVPELAPRQVLVGFSGADYVSAGGPPEKRSSLCSRESQNAPKIATGTHLGRLMPRIGG